MSNIKKLMMTAAGGEALNVEDVFSTYLYTGNSSTQTITNGIDLDGEGGLVWTKNRDTSGYYHNLIDTERGISGWLRTDSANAEIDTFNNAITSFNSDGYSLGTDTYAYVNNNGKNYASWTFRKAPKFFDVVTYTGDGTAGRTISHNLGTTVGMIIVKRLNAGTNWGIYHRSNTSSPEGQLLEFDTGSTVSNTTIWNNTAPTSTVFTVGNSPYSNFNGSTYVAYLFAHNDGDGEFGPTGDQDIIKCGSYTATNGTALDVDLGFEPQWVMVKRYDSTGYWWIQDSMRGWGAENSGDSQKYLQANDTAAEKTKSTDGLVLTSTGFTVPATSGDFNSNGDYIYIAIRRGPMAVPESVTDVFAVAPRTSTSGYEYPFVSDFPVDMGMSRHVDASTEMRVGSRLTGDKFLETPYSNAEQSMSNWFGGDSMKSASLGYSKSAENPPERYGWMWKRAPNFFDVVTYTGTGAARTVSHNLGVAPEMMWVKRRDSSSLGEWVVWHSGFNIGKYLLLNEAQALPSINNAIFWNNTAPTDTVFSLGTYSNANSSTYIAYLFASLDGVSKVGSYTGNGSTQTIDCGFSSGARFVLIKRTSDLGDWHFWDTERGIVTGNDPFLELNTTNAQNSSYDSIDPHSSGFTINNTINTLINGNGNSYIFYAIA